MIFEKYRSNIKNMHFNANIFIAFAFILLISNVFLVIFILKMDQSEKTIVVPASLDKAFWVKGGNISPSYVEQMSRYVSGLILNFHSTNAQKQFEEVMPLVSPSSYQKIGSYFKNKLNEIQENSVTSVFHPMTIKIKGHSAVVSGLQIGSLGSQEANRGVRSYQFDFEYKNGIFKLVDFAELVATRGSNMKRVSVNSNYTLTKDIENTGSASNMGGSK